MTLATRTAHLNPRDTHLTMLGPAVLTALLTSTTGQACAAKMQTSLKKTQHPRPPLASAQAFCCFFCHLAIQSCASFLFAATLLEAAEEAGAPLLPAAGVVEAEAAGAALPCFTCQLAIHCVRQHAQERAEVSVSFKQQGRRDKAAQDGVMPMISQRSARLMPAACQA